MNDDANITAAPSTTEKEMEKRMKEDEYTVIP